MLMLILASAEVVSRRGVRVGGRRGVAQEITARLPGRVEGETTFASPAELGAALRRAEAAHGEHEKRTG